MATDPAPRKRAPRKTATTAVQRRTTGKARTETLAAPFQADPPTVAAANGKAADTITFLNRTMRVRMPTPEQIVIWQRTARKLQGDTATSEMNATPRDGETAEQAQQRATDYATSALDRMLRVVTSVLVDPVDREWVEDQLLEGTLQLAPADGRQGAADIVSMAVATLTGRNEAPTAGPQPRARRRA